MDEEDVVYIDSGISFSHEKKSLNNAICSNINGVRHTTLSKVSQTGKDKYMILLICEIKKMIQMTLFTKQK